MPELIQKISEQPTILIVDDEPINLKLLERALQKEDYCVIKASEGNQALIEAENTNPDLILLDIVMPGMDGYEVCTLLKQNQHTKDIPVIFFSAATDTKNKLKGFEMGGVDYITKPLSAPEVIARVKTHITLHRLQEELDQKNQELNQINQNLEEQVREKTKKLIQQEKSAIIGRLIQGMIHNLKSPLTVITGYNELISSVADLEIKKYSGFIAKAAKQMQQMMDNLMIRSTRDQKAKIEKLNLSCIIEQELALLDANLHFKHNVYKNITLDDSIPSLNLVYSDLSQVFHNLLNNALDAMWQKEEQKIAIKTYQDQDNIYLDIQDNGCGIPADKLDIIFDPFYTSKPVKGEGQDTEPVGTGLGLHTCKDLIGQYGGNIRVKSVLDQGSTFTIVLPKKD